MDTLEKKTKVKELWQLCFHDDERFVNLLFDNLYRDENTICFEKGGKVTTALQMLPYRISFGETSLDVSYISGAATRPEYRNRGLMGRLLKESFEIMRSRNIPLSALAFVVPGDDAVFVKELLAINTEAKEAMLHEVQSAFPGYSLRVFTEPTSENGSAVLMGMIRIVDVRRILEAVAKNNRSLRRVFRVHDSLLPVNNGVFLVEEGECYEGVTNPCDFDIDIMELAEIVFGGSKLSSLLDFPSVRPYMSLMLD